MPEFIMPMGDPKAEQLFHDLPAFTRGYIEAMFFTNSGSGDDGDMEHATFADLAPEALEAIKAECAAFETKHALLLDGAYGHDDYDAESAGRDFWYTRNGHGVGFWDRGLGHVGDLLSDAARHSERSPYMGDDGLVYISA